ncbi:pyridoxal phosphate-dependent aminotransferase [Mycolicibacterium thermoresistibile]
MTSVIEARPTGRLHPQPPRPISATGIPAAVDPMALSLNENPFPPLPAVRTALIEAINAANRYPEFLPEQLRKLIAHRIGVPHEQVILGGGATGVMLQVLHAITEQNDRIVMAAPTFEGYPIVARMNRLEPIEVPLDRHGHHDLPAMAEAAQHARVVALCRPHNPTGTVESGAAIDAFLKRVPADTVVLIDEAYVEFVAPAHRIDSVGLIRRFPNVVVVRTFSKAYGLAGLRIGYAFGSEQLGARLWAMQLPFGMGITSLAAVTASYRAENQLRQRIRMITAERRTLQARLRAMDLYSTDAHANFVYLPAHDRPWKDVFAGTEVRVKHYADGGVRITVGGRSSTGAVLAALKDRR